MGQVFRQIEGRHRALGMGVVDDDPSGHREFPESGYSWFDDSLERLEGKESRQEYYARLVRKVSR